MHDGDLHAKYKLNRYTGKHACPYIHLEELYNREYHIKDEDALQLSSLLLKKRWIPNETVKYIFASGCWAFLYCLCLQYQNTLTKQSDGAVAAFEGLYCYNNTGEISGHGEIGKGKGDIPGLWNGVINFFFLKVNKMSLAETCFIC